MRDELEKAFPAGQAPPLHVIDFLEGFLINDHEEVFMLGFLFILDGLHLGDNHHPGPLIIHLQLLLEVHREVFLHLRCIALIVHHLDAEILLLHEVRERRTQILVVVLPLLQEHLHSVRDPILMDSGFFRPQSMILLVLVLNGWERELHGLQSGLLTFFPTDVYVILLIFKPVIILNPPPIVLFLILFSDHFLLIVVPLERETWLLLDTR
mmetsp:Transcript_9964/g.9878  ORF Transcript_9964/g.9878 Transcript_9964/m.9878 type:complete len:210 (+) Transcript_9964:465-1094(+)